MATLSSGRGFEDRIGISKRGMPASDDCKLRFRKGLDGQIEVQFDLNQGRTTTREYHPKVGEAEARFRKEVEAAGFRYYE